MDVTDVKGSGGTPLGVVMPCSGPSDAPPVATVPPNRCPRAVPSSARRDSRTPGPRGSYCSIPSRRWYLLETIEARLHGGGVVSVFARSFVVLEAGVDYTDFKVHGKHRAVVGWSCLGFLFYPSVATVRRCDIYRAIPTWVLRLQMLRFGSRRACKGV